MFDNIIEQSAVLQLRGDIINSKAAPSMLFFGPSGSGKGSAALELSRVLSCGQAQRGAWKCSCASCGLHRFLLSDDLLVLGSRSFAGDILACQSAFLRNPSNAGVKLLFYRSLRKLLIRFSPVLAGDDPKILKVSSSLHSLDEKLSEFISNNESGGGAARNSAEIEKLSASMVKEALALEKEGLGSITPIGHIRSALYWCRLAPNGNRKTLIIENAENMRDEGRNSLLKLLEEPPASVSIVLTAQRREAIMPTILSRLRPYRFLKRSEESEKEVIRRVFQDSIDGKNINAGGSLVCAYIDSFLPAGAGKTEALAAWFIVSFARITAVYINRDREGVIPPFLSALEERYAKPARDAGLEFPEGPEAGNSSGRSPRERQIKGMSVVKTLLAQCDNFKEQPISRFLKICLDMVSDVSRSARGSDFIAYNDIFKKYSCEAVNACETLNINAAVVLENLFHKLKTAAAGIARGTRGSYG